MQRYSFWLLMGFLFVDSEFFVLGFIAQTEILRVLGFFVGLLLFYSVLFVSIQES